MTALTYPTLPSATKPDSSKYSMSIEDTAISDETEGGYTITRPRHTRKPRRSWVIGYSFIGAADKAAIEAFYDTCLGASRIFNWTDPESLTLYQVRFKGNLQFSYMGRGATRRWDCDFELQQA